MDEIEKLIADGEAALNNRNMHVNVGLAEAETTKVGSYASMISELSMDKKKPESFIDSNIIMSNCSQDQGSYITTPLQNGCAKLVSLCYSMNSALGNANRLVDNLIDDASVNPQVVNIVKSDMEHCVNHCKKNEQDAKQCADQIHKFLQELNIQLLDREDLNRTVYEAKEKCLKLFTLVSELLVETGLKHFIDEDLCENYSLSHVLDTTCMMVTLLSGELPNHIMVHQVEALKQCQYREQALKESIHQLQTQLDRSQQENDKEMAKVMFEMNKLNKDASHHQHQLQLLQLEKDSACESLEEQLANTEQTIWEQRQQIVRIQQEADRKVSSAENKYYDRKNNTKMLEEEVQNAKDLLNKRDEQLNLFKKQAEVTTKDFESKILKMETTIAEITKKNSSCEKELGGYRIKIDKLEKLLEEGGSQRVQLLDEIATLNQKSKERQGNFEDDIHKLESKLEEQNRTLCEKHSEIRNRDVKIMQLQTDLQLADQKVLVSNGESELLEKQVDRLQKKLSKLLETKSIEEKRIIQCTSALERSNSPQQGNKILEESHARELKLQSLLKEKDSEILQIRETLNSEILRKNADLERLTKIIGSLENEMFDISSALRSSRGMAQMSSSVSCALADRSRNVTKLQDSTRRLRAEVSHQSQLNNKTPHPESTSDVLTYKHMAQKAREEARAARLELAKERQRNSFLQIDLQSARSIHNSPAESVVDEKDINSDQHS